MNFTRQHRRFPYLCAVAALSVTAAFAQQEPPKDPPVKAPAPTDLAPVDKRVFGVLPNYRTAEGQAPFEKITSKQKFTIATKDSFDYPVLGTTAFFAALSQIEGDNNRVYGQGLKGFGYRYGVSYVDQVVGNYFPEAIIPSLFHSDPRYFRKGTGSVPSRIGYAVSRIFICKSDKGTNMFNVNEFVGNSAAAIAVSAYHPHERTAGDMASQWESYVLTDMAGQVMKEFWPDIKKAMSKHKHSPSQPIP
jgi:hypothetical protein